MGGVASILNPENISTKENSLCQTVSIEKENLCQVKVCKKLTLCPAKGSKKELCSQRVDMSEKVPEKAKKIGNFMGFNINH